MKIAIIYSTKNGSTEKLARLMGKKFSSDEVSYINLMKEADPILIDFDMVIAGGPVYFGAIQNQLKRFCEKNEKALLDRELALFTTGLLSDQSEQQFDKAFSAKLRDHSISNACFSGVVNFGKLNFFEKLLVWKVAASNMEFHTDTAGITKFVNTIKRSNGLLIS